MNDLLAVLLPIVGNVTRSALAAIKRARQDLTQQEAADLLLQFLAEVIGTDDDMEEIQRRLDERIPPS
jgi:cytochrome P450